MYSLQPLLKASICNNITVCGLESLYVYYHTVECHNNQEDRNLDLHRREPSDLRTTEDRLARSNSCSWWRTAYRAELSMCVHADPARTMNSTVTVRYFETGWFRSRCMCPCPVDLRKVTSGLDLADGREFHRHGRRNIISERDIQYWCLDRYAALECRLACFTFYL
jgi:hypothetical protein